MPCSVLSEVDQQVSLAVSPCGKLLLNITDRAIPCTPIKASVNGVEHERGRGDTHGVQGLLASHVLGAVRDLMDKGHPNRS